MIDPALPLGATVREDGVAVAGWAPDLELLDLLMLDGGEERRLSFSRNMGPLQSLFVPGLRAGARYALAKGEQRLVDPYALALDRPYGRELPYAIVTAPKSVE